MAFFVFNLFYNETLKNSSVIYCIWSYKKESVIHENVHNCSIKPCFFETFFFLWMGVLYLWEEGFLYKQLIEEIDYKIRCGILCQCYPSLLIPLYTRRTNNQMKFIWFVMDCVKVHDSMKFKLALLINLNMYTIIYFIFNLTNKLQITNRNYKINIYSQILY